jgi:hypothetical protein
LDLIFDEQQHKDDLNNLTKFYGKPVCGLTDKSIEVTANFINVVTIPL